MKITINAEVISVVKINDNKFRSLLSWKTGKYTSESCFVPAKLELGSRTLITIDAPESAGIGDDIYVGDIDSGE